jgi:hypothetical protein
VGARSGLVKNNEVMVNLHRLFGIRKENVMLCRWIQSLDPW